jgi:cytoskeletal protein CcmA (bactofilin family)
MNIKNKGETKMKTQKLLVIVAISCLMLGGLGADMAAAKDHECPLGAETGLVLGDVRVSGDCVVQAAAITGNVIVNNASDETFVLYNTIVNGKVKVKGGTVIIKEAVVVSSNLVVNDTINTVVSDTLVAEGNMRFVGNSYVLIESNVVPIGNIRCKDNYDPSGNRADYANQNVVPRGTITCFGQ